MVEGRLLQDPATRTHYRYGQIADGDALAALGTRVFTDAFASLMPKADLEAYLSEHYSTRSIALDLQNPSMTFIVATRDSSLVGFLQLTMGTSESCIDDIDGKIQLQRLYVGRECQGMGVGKHLMALAETEVKSRGLTHIWLASWEDNPKVTRMYENAGYATVGDMAFQLGSLALRDWVMVKKI